MDKITQDTLVDYFNSKEIYKAKKTSNVIARKIIYPELIITDPFGIIETINNVGVIKDFNNLNLGYMVIKNLAIGSSSEEYPLKEEEFKNCYIYNNKGYLHNGHHWGEYTPKRKIRFIKNKDFSGIIKTSWGEMILEKNDILAIVESEYNFEKNKVKIDKKDDIYRIEQNTFKKTYEILKDE